MKHFAISHHMCELSLFTGAGGGLLGTHLLGWTPIGYVEWDDYCQRVIAQRIQDGVLPYAPIFTDVREFVQSGAAREYRGFADVVTGGFPCQPFSVAGKRAGADDERNMWPATIDVIRMVRPKFAFLENVPGLLTSGYFGTILGDLAESGYNARWRILSAAEMGAPHKRDRLWIVAHAKTERLEGTFAKRNTCANGCVTKLCTHVADADSEHGIGRCEPQQPVSDGGKAWDKPSRCSEDVADAEAVHAQGCDDGQREGESWRSSWWQTEPDVGRVVDGVAARVDRLKSLGNGQVPAVAAAAWRLLTEDM